MKPIEFATAQAKNGVYADLLSQAITGELVGMANYATLAGLYDDPAKQIDAVRHAASELGHSERFRRAARAIGVAPIVNPGAIRWKGLRDSFKRHAALGDVTACLIIQEIMLESFAVALYGALGEVDEPELAAVFRATAADEEEHVSHALVELRAAYAADPEGFEAKLEALHDEVMHDLALMMAGDDNGVHCELCHGSCVKQSLGEVGLDRAEMRGRAIQHYLRTLDELGVRGERSLAWVARLPI